MRNHTVHSRHEQHRLAIGVHVMVLLAYYGFPVQMEAIIDSVKVDPDFARGILTDLCSSKLVRFEATSRGYILDRPAANTSLYSVVHALGAENEWSYDPALQLPQVDSMMTDRIEDAVNSVVAQRTRAVLSAKTLASVVNEMLMHGDVLSGHAAD